ncbi:MAG: EF-hand domain-containing protein [Gammaproteobacteria bacterium]|nr:EF-hand domain-containing protein [Gammaproteobacteria bacterium]NIN62359.1 EF-hand domain-containing protein [Gammaproteobacteria bacterium]NIO61413.1 EF-hand domain-containing protein [Gammaproteobacteria bacterium]NIP49872.1 EF-hand domain-containing protein [Gammaproteobacteria bacterium]NIQ11905.1 EF-hand domain-containing protein [Gammaproteobacteria bacterium]
MPELDQDQIEEMKESFDYFDTDKNGQIDFNEFVQFMGVLDSEMSNEEMEVGFDIIDSDNNGAIDFDEFMDWWSEL